MSGLRVVLTFALISATLATASLGPGAAAREPRGWGAGITPGSILDMVVDGDGNLVVLAADPPHVIVLSPNGRLIASWGRPGQGPGRLAGPTSLAVAPSGNVLVSDAGNEVEEFTVDGGFVRQWPMQGGAIAAGSSGEVYVVDGDRVLVYDASGSLLDEWRSERWRDRGYEATGDPGLVRAIDVAVGPDDLVYILDSYREVEVFTQDGTSLGGWSAPSWYMNDSANGLSIGGGLAVVVVESGLVSRFTTDGGYLGTMGTPVDYMADDWDSGATGLSDDMGITINPGLAAVGSDGTVYVSGWALHGPERILRFPPPVTPAHVGYSELDFASGAPRFVPMGSDSSTRLAAVVRDGGGQPLDSVDVTLAARPSDGRIGLGGGVLDSNCVTGEAPGEYLCEARFSSGVLGGYEVRLVDVATGATLTGPVHVETTRKIVVLVQGFNSALKKRFCYWGAIRRTGRQDCESLRDRVLAETGGVYGKLVDLGFRADEGFGDPGATILDMSWDLVPCGHSECVAEVKGEGGDVSWLAKPYDIGGIRAPTSVSRQLEIDRYAAALAETLARYDQALADAHNGIGAHATFFLVGHSMGGELVVRTLNSALAHAYFIDPNHRGLLRTAIAVDGALNWGTVVTSAANFMEVWSPDVGTFALVPGKGVTHCDSTKGFVYTKPSATKEVENANAAQLAYELMGTTTVVLTNGNDWVVPYDPELVELPVALLDSPVQPDQGYKRRLFWGYGKGEAGDPDCGHSTLLREQPGGLYLSDKWDDEGVNPKDYRAKSMFPLGRLLENEEFVGYATRENA